MGKDENVCIQKTGKFLQAFLLVGPPWQEGRACAAFDYTYDNIYHDMNGPEGFTHALYHVLRLEPGSFLTLAPVCSTWVFMSPWQH